MKNKLVYYIGLLLGSKFRIWYYEKTKGKYHWGLIRFVNEMTKINNPEIKEFNYEE